MTQKILPGTHCSGCGDEPESTDEGYTDCCNEPVCWSDGYTDRYAVGPTCGAGPDGEVRACCPAAATLKAEAIGKVYLYRII